MCKEQGIKWCDRTEINENTRWNMHCSNTCYEYENDLQFCDLEYFVNYDYKIIRWEIDNMDNNTKVDIKTTCDTVKENNNTKTNSITYNYNKEYTIHEVFEFVEGTEFVSCDKYKNIYKICGEDLYYKDRTWFISSNTLKWKLNTKFKLISKDKEVSFLEAIQSYGKTVYCKTGILGKEFIYTFKINSADSSILDSNLDAITPNEILNGKWFIKVE